MTISLFEKTFLALGNCKPPDLVSAENAIWKTLFGLADGTLEPDHLLDTLVDSLPWEEIALCSSEDRAWFSFGEFVVKVAFFKNSH